MVTRGRRLQKDPSEFRGCFRPQTQEAGGGRHGGRGPGRGGGVNAITACAPAKTLRGMPFDLPASPQPASVPGCGLTGTSRFAAVRHRRLECRD